MRAITRAIAIDRGTATAVGTNIPGALAATADMVIA
jgi:hypothetical protein